MKPIAKVYTAIIFLFLFAPIAILLVFSFNSGNSLSVFSGFSLYWYKELFQDSNTLGGPAEHPGAGPVRGHPLHRPGYRRLGGG